MRFLKTAAPLLVALTGTLAWAEDATTVPTTLHTGDWRFVVDTPIGELPFNMELVRDGDDWTATFINGPERMETEVTNVRGTSLVIEFPSYGHSISGALVKNGSMQGVIQFNKQDGTYVVPFSAVPGESRRFFADTVAPNENLDGRWAASSMNRAFATEPNNGLLELSDDGSVVVGTSMVTTGDSRFLTGVLRGNDLYL